jgi:hypothetical protein
MYKYNRTFQNGAEKFANGIENVEMFLDDDNGWSFHDSQLYSFHWDEHPLEFTVTVMPQGYLHNKDNSRSNMMALLDFHFIDVDEVKMQLTPPYYIDGIEFTQEGKGIECWIGGYGIYIHCRSVTVDPPRFVPEEFF